MNVPSPRLQILDEINVLENTHCSGCHFRNKSSICPETCEINIQIKHLGKTLISTRAKDSSKYKNNTNVKIKKIPKKVVETLKIDDKPKYKELTEERLRDLIAQGYSNKKIQEMHGLNNVEFYQKKNDWGMVRQTRKRDEVPVDATPVEEKLIQKDSVIKSLLLQKDELIKKMHNLRSEDVEVIDKLKLENKSLLNEVATLRTDTLLMSQLKAKNAALTGVVQRDVPIIRGMEEQIRVLRDALKIAEKDRVNNIDISNNKDKVFRLESLLAHAEKSNDTLIAQIKAINKYKNMYFKTAETLKLHLPS